MEQMPQEGQAMPQEGQQEGGDIGQFVQGLGQGIATLGEMVQKTEGAPPEAAQLVDQLMGTFDQLMQIMAGGGGEQAAPQDQRAQAVPVQQPEGVPV